ncbi:MAG: hypothetical protein NTW07_13720 [candidate division Zixibacteria bacterium]|nr:hypothetical protein [candidate division Zixibacteria bacterium]
MRKSLVILLPLAVLALTSMVIQGEEVASPKWLDPHGCYFCQPLTLTEGLMEHLTWEHHNIKNGMVTVTTYAPEWKEKYKAASADMEKRWMGYDPTKPQPLCGMCAAWMKMPMDKVAWETVEFKGGEIGITTSTDSAVVAQLHEITDKTCAAMDEMMKMQVPTEK